MIRRLFPIVALTALAGCVTQPAAITSQAAPYRFVAGYPADRIAEGTTKTVIRTYRKGVNDKGKEVLQEVVGVPCVLESDHLRAEITSPQEVLLPKYDQDKDFPDRGVAPSILITCTSGALKGTSLLAARPGKIVSGSGNLAVDLILITGSAIAATTANWKYDPAANVTIQ